MAIRLARWLSLPVVSQGTAEQTRFTTSDNARLQAAVDGAYTEFADILVDYLMRKTACGVSVVFMASCYHVAHGVTGPFATVASWFAEVFGRPTNREAVTLWMGSHRIEELSQVEYAIRRKPAPAVA